jgi:hypothetical protein
MAADPNVLKCWQTTVGLSLDQHSMEGHRAKANKRLIRVAQLLLKKYGTPTGLSADKMSKKDWGVSPFVIDTVLPL